MIFLIDGDGKCVNTSNSSAFAEPPYCIIVDLGENVNILINY